MVGNILAQFTARISLLKEEGKFLILMDRLMMDSGHKANFMEKASTLGQIGLHMTEATNMGLNTATVNTFTHRRIFTKVNGSKDFNMEEVHFSTSVETWLRKVYGIKVNS